jgi:hypothetical protein
MSVDATRVLSVLSVCVCVCVVAELSAAPTNDRPVFNTLHTPHQTRPFGGIISWATIFKSYIYVLFKYVQSILR